MHPINAAEDRRPRAQLVAEMATQLAPYGLLVETGGDQFPVSPSRPQLSWKLPTDMAEQDALELQAMVDGEQFDHTEQTSRHSFIEWPWRDLQSCETVLWRVRSHGGDDPAQWSEWSAFEAGLFEPDWAAAWISAPIGMHLPVGARPAYAFSKGFPLSGQHADARLYVTALGVYDAYLNGDRLGSGELSPGSESYDRTVYVQAYDVAGPLVDGENRLELVLSDGWYRGRAGAYREEAGWTGSTAIRAELRLDRDGTADPLVVTDSSWTVHETEIVRADLMDGQTTDLTGAIEVLGPAMESTTPAPPATWSPAPPVRVVASLQPRAIRRLNDRTVVVDFGQNASGRVRLTDLGPSASRTTLTYGEHVDVTGAVTLSHLDTPAHDGTTVSFRQQDEVVSNGNPRSVFEPHHTVHGFRYVQIERDNLDISPADITMQVLHTDLRRVGSFDSSDDDLNQLWQVADWSFRGNAVDIPTDCPTRERAGWTGDYQIFLPTAVRLYDVDGFSRKWLQAVRDDQLDDGRIVNISPDATRMRTVPNPGVDFATGSAGWGDAIILVPWELYTNYGDSQVLADSWQAMTKWIDFALNAAATNRHPTRVARSAEPQPHEQYIWDGTFHFGEWLEPVPVAEDGTPGPTMPDPMAWAMADKGEVGTAYLARSLATLAKIAKVLEREEDELRYQKLATAVRAAWQIEFIDADGRTPNNTQASYVRALAFDLVPSHLRARAAEHLVGLIEAAHDHLGTGFLSTADLLPVLADSGHADVAHRLLWQRTTPSWLGMLDRGATTIWEEWEGVDRNGNAHASLNHYSKGSVIRYLHSHILGMRPTADAVAWNRFTVEPTIPDALTHARGSFDSPQGLIDVAWSVSDSESILRVIVPGGAIATLIWGDQRVQVTAGEHELRTTGRAAQLRS